MLAVSVELLFGTLRSGSADELPASGALDPGEWPPSPARLLSALVAADGTGPRCKVTTGEELFTLENAEPPRIVCDGGPDVERSALAARFVVVDQRSQGTVQEYPARTATEARAGSRLCPADPRIVYVWDDLDVSADTLAALRKRAARIAYLGCADSPVRLTVSIEPTDDQKDAWEPDPTGSVALPVPYDGFVADLDRLFERFTSGEWVRRSWLPPVRRAYRDPASRQPVKPPGPVVVWLRFEGTLAGRHALLVTEALKAATMELYDRHVCGGTGEVPPVVTGHGFDTPTWRQALYVALPHVGVPYADGRLQGAAVVLPPLTDPLVIEGIRTALWQLRELGIGLDHPIGIRPYGGEERPRTATPQRWTEPARDFTSALPVVHERFRKGGPVLEDVAAWCEHADLPEPVAFRSSPVPLLAGAPHLRPHEVYRPDRPRRPYSHVSIRFSDPVVGPVVLGRARSFGLGLMAPVGRSG